MIKSLGIRAPDESLIGDISGIGQSTFDLKLQDHRIYDQPAIKDRKGKFSCADGLGNEAEPSCLLWILSGKSDIHLVG